LPLQHRALIYAFARKLGQLRDIRCNPSRLFFAEQNVAPISSTDHGSGKRRTQERQTAEHWSGRLATSKSRYEAQ